MDEVHDLIADYAQELVMMMMMITIVIKVVVVGVFELVVPMRDDDDESGEIFGILKQMKETFEANLSESQKEEIANQKAYEDPKAAKEAEIVAGQAQIDAKTQAHADTEEKLA